MTINLRRTNLFLNNKKYRILEKKMKSSEKFRYISKQFYMAFNDEYKRYKIDNNTVKIFLSRETFIFFYKNKCNFLT